ncbi:MAG: invasion associated locus B family protein [Pseudomonadota bacterium]
MKQKAGAIFMLAASLALMPFAGGAQEQTDGGLSLGEPVDDTPQPGQTYTDSTQGDWSIRCIKLAEGTDPCQMNQRMADETGNSIAEIAMFIVEPGGAAVMGANIVTPLETLLTQQLRVRIDDAEAKAYPFTFCAQSGCVARVGFTAADLNNMQKGTTATVTIVPAQAPDRTVNAVLSLNGFTAAYDRLLELSAN